SLFRVCKPARKLFERIGIELLVLGHQLLPSSGSGLSIAARDAGRGTWYEENRDTKASIYAWKTDKNISKKKHAFLQCLVTVIPAIPG
ncbi:MAG: hypothetical protein OET55_06725, partial [Desulfuromonadales bacterium]|nr:hypothetical protein [Desulfuromonadales bacterium]MDH3960951.1 hypothetical protein [Desulfuromonadales bacterium]MDH4025019.1 hypothetical protein [Desulfuromonadales bacterium]